MTDLLKLNKLNLPRIFCIQGPRKLQRIFNALAWMRGCEDKTALIRGVTNDQLVDDVFNTRAILPHYTNKGDTVGNELLDERVEFHAISLWAVQDDLAQVRHLEL